MLPLSTGKMIFSKYVPVASQNLFPEYVYSLAYYKLYLNHS